MLGRKKVEQGRRRPSERQGGGRTYSYYASLPEGRTSPQPEKTIDLGSVGHRLRLMPTIIALLVIISSVLFSLTLSTRPSVTLVADQQPVYRPLEDYAAKAQELMGQKPANRTKLTINTADTEQALLTQFPELDGAVLRLPVLGRKPSLVVSVRRPMLLLATNSKTFVLDRFGIAVSEVGQLDDAAKQGLLVVRDQSGLEVNIGKQAVTTETVSFILQAQAQLSENGMKVSELTLPARVNELDIRLDGLNYFVKTDVSGDARLQIGSFLAVKEHLAGRRVVPAEYIDVRVEEKVFYR